MTQSKIYTVQPEFAKAAHVSKESYEELYQKSVANPDAFWADIASQQVTWSKEWDAVSNWNYDTPTIEWFKGATLNVAENCLDRHLKDKGDKTAIIFEPDEPGEEAQHITFNELHKKVCAFANGLESLGVTKGDRVCLYMPMVPDAAVAMLACARIGAVHSVVFGGFSADALYGRVVDADAKVVITADEARRGGKRIPLKKTTDEALSRGKHSVEHVVMLEHTGADVPVDKTRDVLWAELVRQQSTDHSATQVEATDPLFILYTSGSTGKPKGVVHSSGGDLTYASTTHKYVFDIQDDDIFWCSADVGWITGHSYVVHGPLCNGCTTVMFEGVPTYPNPSRFWDVIDRHKVTIFYTAPTAIRALEAKGDEWVTKTDRSSLRLLGTVGEPINPEAWEWYYHVVGNDKSPIVDTWWQTETGGIMITPLPGATDLKPGSATRPFFGIQPTLVDENNNELDGAAEGRLCIKASWPGQMITVYGDHQRFKETYFSQVPGMYFAGDGARRDEDGYYWITGRIDDVLNVSGHRLGTAEIESALVLHKGVSEAAVVGFPHNIKGEGIYAYVTLHDGYEPSDDLQGELVGLINKEIGPIAKPDAIQWAPNLPKTRSGKIMRRILRKLAAHQEDELGDTSTLADPTAVDELLKNRVKLS